MAAARVFVCSACGQRGGEVRPNFAPARTEATGSAHEPCDWLIEIEARRPQLLGADHCLGLNRQVPGARDVEQPFAAPTTRRPDRRFSPSTGRKGRPESRGSGRSSLEAINTRYT